MADLEMTSVEIANYLKIECDSHQSMVYFLEDTLEIKITISSFYAYDIKRLVYVYHYNNKNIGDTHNKDIGVIVTGIWSELSSEQRQKVIDTVKGMQSRKLKASKPKNSASGTNFVNKIEVNANATNNNTNTSTNLAYANSKSITDLILAISNDANLSKEVKQEYQDLFNKIEDNQGDKSYAELILQLLNKLANDNILPIPKWLLKAIDKALKIFKK